jgi:hypothetical protein
MTCGNSMGHIGHGFPVIMNLNKQGYMAKWKCLRHQTGGREKSISWVDNEGSFWIFGGNAMKKQVIKAKGKKIKIFDIVDKY